MKATIKQLTAVLVLSCLVSVPLTPKAEADGIFKFLRKNLPAFAASYFLFNAGNAMGALSGALGGSSFPFSAPPTYNNNPYMYNPYLAGIDSVNAQFYGMGGYGYGGGMNPGFPWSGCGPTRCWGGAGGSDPWGGGGWGGGGWGGGGFGGSPWFNQIPGSPWGSPWGGGFGGGWGGGGFGGSPWGNPWGSPWGGGGFGGGFGGGWGGGGWGGGAFGGVYPPYANPYPSIPILPQPINNPILPYANNGLNGFGIGANTLGAPIGGGGSFQNLIGGPGIIH